MDSVSRIVDIDLQPTYQVFLELSNMVLFSPLFLLVSCVVSFAAGATYIFQDDCAKYPGPCNNDCYAIFTAGLTNVWNVPGHIHGPC